MVFQLFDVLTDLSLYVTKGDITTELGIQKQGFFPECTQNRQGQTRANNNIRGTGKRVIHKTGKGQGRQQ